MGPYPAHQRIPVCKAPITDLAAIAYDSTAYRIRPEVIATVFAGAAWRCCRTHFTASLLTRVPKRSQPVVATTVRTTYRQFSPEEVHTQADRVAPQLREHFPLAALMLADALLDIVAFTAVPVSHWQKLWSNNPLERLNNKMRWRGALPGREHGEYLPQPSSTANGLKDAATSPSPTMSTPRPYRLSTSWRPPPEQHQHG